jgi:hypothetical protein
MQAVSQRWTLTVQRRSQPGELTSPLCRKSIACVAIVAAKKLNESALKLVSA